jgi:transcription-repair coupling factor (superfamily II helicase)
VTLKNVTPKTTEKTTASSAAARLRTLADLPPMLEASCGLAKRLKGWKPGRQIAFDGVFGGIRSLLATTLARHTSHVLVIVPQAVDADIVSGDCAAFGNELRWPSR